MTWQTHDTRNDRPALNDHVHINNHHLETSFTHRCPPAPSTKPTKPPKTKRHFTTRSPSMNPPHYSQPPQSQSRLPLTPPPQRAPATPTNSTTGPTPSAPTTHATTSTTLSAEPRGSETELVTQSLLSPTTRFQLRGVAC